MTEPLLKVEGLRKSFAGNAVLKGISFEVRAGEVHALVGENGSGKSTAMNLLAGLLPRDGGEIAFDGRPWTPASSRQAQAAGLAFIQQHSNVFTNLSIEDNLFVGHPPWRARWLPLIDRARMRRRGLAALQQVGLALPLSTPGSALSPGERQLVEIARALLLEPWLVIFDEPTTSMASTDCERLFALIAELRAQGRGIVYISHVLGDVLRIADRVTVLRDGAVVDTAPREQMTLQRAIRGMVGRAIDTLYPPRRRPARAGAPPLLQVQALGEPGLLRDISFTLAGGEILGLGGLMGSGRSELARMLFGLDPFSRGGVRMEGRALASMRPAERLAAGMAFVGEDRQREGLMLPASAEDNLALAALPRFGRGPLFGCGAWRRLQHRALAAATHAMAQRVGLATVARDPLRQPAAAFSGGNQQKLVLGKWLLRQPRLLILDEPTHGVDVGARAEIYRLVVQLADEGCGVLLISSELEELLGLCDRLLVLRRGEIGAAFERAAFDRERILAASMWKERAA